MLEIHMAEEWERLILKMKEAVEAKDTEAFGVYHAMYITAQDRYNQMTGKYFPDVVRTAVTKLAMEQSKQIWTQKKS